MSQADRICPPQKSDTRQFRLDLERDLDNRNPPGAVGHVTVEDAVAQRYRAKKGVCAGAIWTTKEKNIGRALVSSHRLTDLECQCRHHLTIDGVLRACLAWKARTSYGVQSSTRLLAETTYISAL